MGHLLSKASAAPARPSPPGHLPVRLGPDAPLSCAGACRSLSATGLPPPPVRLPHLRPRLLPLRLAGPAPPHRLADVRRPRLAALAGRDLLSSGRVLLRVSGLLMRLRPACGDTWPPCVAALEAARPLGHGPDTQRFPPLPGGVLPHAP